MNDALGRASATPAPSRLRRLVSRRDRLSPPEVREGLPVVGPATAFQRDPVGLLGRARARYGDVFTIDLVLHRMTFVVGAEEQRRWFLAPPDELDLNGAAKDMLVSVMGPRHESARLEANDATSHELMRRGLMKQERLDVYMRSVERVAREFFERWSREPSIDLFREVSRLVNHANVEALVGPDIRAKHGETISNTYYALETNGLAAEVVAFPSLPTPAQRRCTEARETMRSVIRDIVAIRGARRGDDYVSLWLDEVFSDGAPPNIADLTSHFIGLFFAAHTNTTATMAWVLAHLGHDATLRQRARDEQASFVARHGDAIEFGTLRDLRFLDGCMKEAVRQNFGVLLMRRAMRDYPVGPYVVPAGELICIAPILNHLDARYYPNPERFDPDRFTDVSEARRLEREALFVQFGLGGHRCLGEMFANSVLKTCWSVFLREYDLTLENPDLPPPDYTKTLGSAFASSPIRARVTRR